MRTGEFFTSVIPNIEQDPEFLTELAILEFTESVCKVMEERDISRSALAESLGVTKANVSKMLRGDTNFTLKSMVRVALALGAELRPQVVPMIDGWINADLAVGAKVIPFPLQTGPTKTVSLDDWEDAAAGADRGGFDEDAVGA